MCLTTKWLCIYGITIEEYSTERKIKRLMREEIVPDKVLFYDMKRQAIPLYVGVYISFILLVITSSDKAFKTAYIKQQNSLVVAML